MTRSPTGIIPQHWNTAKDLPEVLKFLRLLNVSFQDRQELLFGWARNVGVKIRPSDYDTLLE
jgi:hypothetical protein